MTIALTRTGPLPSSTSNARPLERLVGELAIVAEIRTSPHSVSSPIAPVSVGAGPGAEPAPRSVISAAEDRSVRWA